MEVVTIESGAFQQMVGMVSTILNKVEILAEENKKLKDDRLMSITELMEYTGFGKTWLMQHKEEIGYMQIGSSPLKFRKINVDAYLAKHFIKRK